MNVLQDLLQFCTLDSEKNGSPPPVSKLQAAASKLTK